MAWTLVFEGWLFGSPPPDHARDATHSRQASERATDAPPAHPANEEIARDHALLERIRSGEGATAEAAFAELMRYYLEPLYRYAYTKTGDSASAEEIVQALFVHCWERRHTLIVQGSVHAYLLHAIKNRVANLWRHTHRHRRLLHAVAQDYTIFASASTNAGEEHLAQSDLERVVRTTLATLPPRVREIYVLAQQQELSAAEIATVLGISVATVQNQISRARQAIVTAVRRWQSGG